MWYSRIADLYDGLVQFDDDIPFFLEKCKEAPGPVLELMAGTGRVSIPLLEAGVELTCVDSSAEMLECLRGKLNERNLKARVVEADVRRLRLPVAFHLVIIPFNSFSELVSEEDRRSALGSIHRALLPGGRFICTLHNPSVRIARLAEEKESEKRFMDPSGGGEVVFHLSCEYEPTTRIVTGVESFDIFSATGELRERRRVEIAFSLPDRDGFERAAREAGFSVESILGDYDGSQYREEESPSMIWILRKRGAD